MPWLIGPTWSSNENYNGDADYCLVYMDADHAAAALEHMEKVIELKRLMPKLTRLVLWDACCYWVDLSEVPERAQDVLEEFEDSEFCEISDKLAEMIKEHTTRTECDTVSVDERHVYWSTIPKHSDIRVESPGLYADKLWEIRGR